MPKQLSFYLAVITIFSLPLYVVRFELLGLPSTLLEVLILTTALTWFIEVVFSGQVKNIWQRLGSPIFYLGAGLVFVAAVSALVVSPDRWSSLGLWRAYFLEPFVFSVVVLDLARRTEKGHWFIWSLLGSGLWLALMGIAQVWLGLFADITPDALREVRFGRAIAVFNSANSLALYLGPLTVLAFHLALQGRRIYFWIALTLIAGVLATKSDGGMVSLAAASAFVLVGRYWNDISEKVRKLFWKILPLVISAGAATLLLIFLTISNFAPDERPAQDRLYHDTGVLRICLWEGTKELLSEKAVVGVGLGNFPEVYEDYSTCDLELLQYPHNIFLNFWVELGLVGLVIFIFLQTKIFKILRQTNAYWSVGLASAFVYWLVHGLVDVPYFKNDLATEFWVLASLSVAVSEGSFKLRDGLKQG